VTESQRLLLAPVTSSEHRRKNCGRSMLSGGLSPPRPPVKSSKGEALHTYLNRSKASLGFTRYAAGRLAQKSSQSSREATPVPGSVRSSQMLWMPSCLLASLSFSVRSENFLECVCMCVW
jgi:hypothetical protein